MDGKIVGGGLIAMMAGGAFVIGGPGQGELYDISPAQAATMLANAPFGESLDDAASQGELSMQVRKHGQGQVVWEFSTLGQPLADFTAELTPEANGTRVVVNFAMADGSIADAARTDLGGAAEMFEATVRLGLVEHVDSVLEKRPFNEKKFLSQMAAYAASNPDALKKYAARAQAAETESGPSALEMELEKQREADAAWHADAPRERPVSDFDGSNEPAADDWGS